MNPISKQKCPSPNYSATGVVSTKVLMGFHKFTLAHSLIDIEESHGLLRLIKDEKACPSPPPKHFLKAIVRHSILSERTGR